MIHYKPTDYPQPHIPDQHKFLATKWDSQQGVPAGAESQVYDSTERTLSYLLDGEQFTIPVTTPPLWAGKDVGEWSK